MMPAHRLLIAGIWIAVVARVAPAEPTTGPVASYFPLKPGATWKYLVSVKLDDKPKKPYVETVTAGEPTRVNGQEVIPVDEIAYGVKGDGVYLMARREGGKLVALDEPQKVMPLRPRTSESWNFTSKQGSTYSTCLGSQTIKTDAGQFDTQCVFSSTASGAEGENRRQTYRYFSKDVGLVRETVTEIARQPDGTPATQALVRDLIAVSGLNTEPKAVEVAEPAGGGKASSAESFAAAKKLAAAGDHRAAIEAYASLLKSAPADTSVRAYKAASHLALRQRDLAQQEIDEAMKRDEKNPLVYEIAGQVKIFGNEIAPARALYDKAAQLAPRDAGAIYTDLAAALAARKDDRLATAIDGALKTAAAADPPGSEALFQLGQGYANSGRPEAKGYLQRYIDVVTKLPPAEQDARKLQLARQLLRAMNMVRP